jgi:hypothetical protein
MVEEIKYTKTELLHLLNMKKSEHDNKKIEINKKLDEIDQLGREIDQLEREANIKIDKHNELLEELKPIELEYVNLMKEYTSRE